jgi:hypothetical protein
VVVVAVNCAGELMDVLGLRWENDRHDQQQARRDDVFQR